MNSKSIRLEALRLAASLDPVDSTNLIGYANHVEQFILFGVPGAGVEDPLFSIRRTLERIESRQTNWSEGEQKGFASDFLVGENVKAASAKNEAMSQTLDKVKEFAGAKAPAKRRTTRRWAPGAKPPAKAK